MSAPTRPTSAAAQAQRLLLGLALCPCLCLGLGACRTYVPYPIIDGGLDKTGYRMVGHGSEEQVYQGHAVTSRRPDTSPTQPVEPPPEPQPGPPVEPLPAPRLETAPPIAEAPRASDESDPVAAYLAAHPDLPGELRVALQMGELALGMPSDAVLALFGRDPVRTMSFVEDDGRHSSWFFDPAEDPYGRPLPQPATAVFLVEGIVVGYRD